MSSVCVSHILFENTLKQIDHLNTFLFAFSLIHDFHPKFQVDDVKIRRRSVAYTVFFFGTHDRRVSELNI